MFSVDRKKAKREHFVRLRNFIICRVKCYCLASDAHEFCIRFLTGYSPQCERDNRRWVLPPVLNSVLTTIIYLLNMHSSLSLVRWGFSVSAEFLHVGSCIYTLDGETVAMINDPVSVLTKMSSKCAIRHDLRHCTNTF